MAKFTDAELRAMKPKEFRNLVRKGEYADVTIEACQDTAHANLVMVPKEYAFEFLLFCSRNPAPCPVLEVLEAGDPEPKKMATGADLRTDLPRYRVYRDGKLIEEPTDVTKYWRDDLVCFLLGCGRSAVWVLRAANVTAWRRFGPYRTEVQTVPAGRLHGTSVLAFQGYENTNEAIRAIQITSRYPLFHGAPLHIGNPADIGVENFGQADPFNPYRPVLTPKPGEIFMGWGCGVTPQTVVMESKVPLAITHAPGHLFVSDRLAEEFATL